MGPPSQLLSDPSLALPSSVSQVAFKELEGNKPANEHSAHTDNKGEGWELKLPAVPGLAGLVGGLGLGSRGQSTSSGVQS